MATQPQLALAEVVSYDVTETQIAELQARFTGLSFETPDRYDEGRKALATLRGLRTAVERRRKELKAEHLERGRKIDQVAKHFTGLIEAIEQPLLDAKALVDGEKERLEREKREADLLAREAALKAEQEATEARTRGENERLAAERAAFAEAQRKADEERAARDEADRVEREKAQAKLDADRAYIEAERRAIEAARRVAARAEEDRLAKARAEQEAAEQAERDRVAAEQRRTREEAEARRMEALRPELERAAEFGRRIAALADDAPALHSQEAANRIDWACARLRKISEALTGEQAAAPPAPIAIVPAPAAEDPSGGLIR